MLVSEIKTDGITWQYLPIPNRDSYRMIRNSTDIAKYIEEFQDYEIQENPSTGYYYCPTLEAGRREYRKQVERDCKIWGCKGS